MQEAAESDCTDTRSYCAYARLKLSLTENAILRKDFEKAKSYLASVKVRNQRSGQDPSGQELQLLRLKNTVYGRVLRYKGDFPAACDYLKQCLEMIRRDASRYHIMYHLGDVYCELGRQEEAELLVLGDIKHLREHGKQKTKAFRRLALLLVECYISGKRSSGQLRILF